MNMENEMIATNKIPTWALVHKTTGDLVGVYQSRTLARMHKDETLTLKRALVTLI